MAWVVGAPTHIGSATGGAKGALKKAFASGTTGKRGTTFDTRFKNIKKGGAEKLQGMMEKAGVKVIVPPEWFVVEGMKGPLVEGEEAKAAEFGRRIAKVI